MRGSCIMSRNRFLAAWVVTMFAAVAQQAVAQDKTAPKLAEDKKPKEAKARPLDPRAQAAVDKGVAFLRAELTRDDKMRAGAVGLLGLALLECGASADDPDVK